MGTQRGYHSYRGRRSAGRTAIVVILSVLLLLAAGYLVLQNFIVYESDGSVRLDLPFLSQKKDEADPAEDSEEDIPPVEILPSGTEGEPGGEPIRAGMLTAAELCRTGGPVLDKTWNSVAVEMKSDNGFFHYASPLAKQGALSDGAVNESSVTEALAAHSELHAIARISCFHDSFFAFSDMAGAGICQPSGYIWYDSQSSYWLNPAKPAAREYLYAVAEECVAMGFDELLLTEFTYPTAGRLEQIDYSGMTMTKEEALGDFLTGLRERVGEEIAVSVELPAAVLLEGSDKTAGLSAEDLLPLLDRVYVEAEDPGAVLAALEAAGMEQAAEKLAFVQDGVYCSAAQ